MIQINSPAKSREEEVVVKNILLPSPGRWSTKEQVGEGWLVLWLVVDLKAGCFGMSVVLVGVFPLSPAVLQLEKTTLEILGEEVGCGDGEGGDLKQAPL